MKTLSLAGLEFIKSFEKLRLIPYKDQGGKYTIGYGHLLRRTELDQLGRPLVSQITLGQALAYLRKDVQEAESCLNSKTYYVDKQYEIDALVSFIYNVGCEAFRMSTMARHLSHDPEMAKLAVNEFQRWIYVDGNPSNGLKNRRLKERDMFLGKPVDIYTVLDEEK